MAALKAARPGARAADSEGEVLARIAAMAQRW